MFRVYKEKNSLIALRRNVKWNLVFAEIASFKGAEIVYVLSSEEGGENAVVVEKDESKE